MKFSFKKAGFAAVSLACIMMLASCGSSGGGKVTVATNAEFPPFEYVTKTGGIVGEFSGIDIAISRDIAKALGKDLEVMNIEFDAVIAAIPSGKADFAAAGLTADDERRLSVDFSIPYFVAEQNIIVPESDDKIKSAADIMDKNVGAVTAFTGETVCRDMGVPSLSTYASAMQAVADLKNGKLDCVVVDSKTAEAIVSRNEGLKIITDSAAFETEQYAIAVKKGNTELLNKINEVLQKIIDDGTLDSYVEQFSVEAE